jgi:hypothetical protein
MAATWCRLVSVVLPRVGVDDRKDSLEMMSLTGGVQVPPPTPLESTAQSVANSPRCAVCRWICQCPGPNTPSCLKISMSDISRSNIRSSSGAAVPRPASSETPGQRTRTSFRHPQGSRTVHLKQSSNHVGRSTSPKHCAPTPPDEGRLPGETLRRSRLRKRDGQQKARVASPRAPLSLLR